MAAFDPPPQPRCSSMKRIRVDPPAVQQTVGLHALSMAGDNVSLSLVLGCLDAYSILRCRRVSRAWRAASFKPEAWLDADLTINAHQLQLLPPASIAAVQRLCLVRNTRVRQPANARLHLFTFDFDPTATLERLSAMPRLRTLRVEEMFVDARFCNLLSTHAPGLRELDLSMCSEFDADSPLCANQHVRASGKLPAGYVPAASKFPACLTAEASVASLDAYADNRSLLASAANSASPAVAEALRYMGLPAAPHMPVLRLPRLTLLKTQPVHSLRYLLALVSELAPLRVLELARCSSSEWADSEVTERHFGSLFNRTLANLYAESLRSLALSNTHAPFDGLHLASLQRLEHLSLTQHNDFPGVTRHVLLTIARDMPSLRECEVRVSGDELEDADWWSALVSVRALTAFGAMSSWSRPLHGPVALAGLRRLLAAPELRLGRLEIYVGALDLARGHPHLHTLCLDGDVVSVDLTDALVTLPRLTSLKVASRMHALQDLLLERIAEHLPLLRALALRSVPGMYYTTSNTSWRVVTTMPRLASLTLACFDSLTDTAVGAICAQLAAFGTQDACALTELHLTGRMVAYPQCARLLRASRQLHLVTVNQSGSTAYEFSSPSGVPTPRFVVRGITAMQRGARSYDSFAYSIKQ